MDTVFSSNALEGYSYSLSETRILREDGLTAGGKPLRDAFAVVGLGRAYDYMFSLLHHVGITEHDVVHLHEMLHGSLENDALAGAYRQTPAFISGSRYPVSRPEDIESRMRGLLARVSEERETLHPLVAAARFHKEFVFIHPFSDGNGRIARLVPLAGHPASRFAGQGAFERLKNRQQFYASKGESHVTS